MKGQRERSKTGVPCPKPDKDRYRSKEKAKAALVELNAKFGDQGRLHAYLCERGYWHLGRPSRGSGSDPEPSSVGPRGL